MIHCAVPASLASDVTVRILRHVLLTYRDLVEYPCFRSYCEGIAPVVVRAILHPSVMKLECFENTPHPTVIDRYKVWYSDLIFDALPKLKNLKVLRLGSSNNFSERRLNKNDFCEELEEFSYRFCEDEELEALSKASIRLKRLDLSDSYLTDKCVDFVLNFRHLEELFLNCVSVSQDGLTQLLNGLTKTKVSDSENSSCLSLQFKSFGCYSPSHYHLNVIADKFTNLISLSVCNVQCSLTPLNELKHLTKLALKTVLFCLVDELLTVVGRRILCLNLRDVHDTDFRVIAENCPKLRCLHLSFITFRGLDPEQCKAEVCAERCPELKSVTFLELELFDQKFSQTIISRCANVRKLFLSNGGSDTLINLLLQRKQLRHLEQLFCTESQNVDIVVQFSENVAVITEIDYYSDKISIYSTPVK
jgi:hypothetical protein